MQIRKTHAFGHGHANQVGGGDAAGAGVGGEARHGNGFFGFAEAVRDFEFVAEVGEAFEFADGGGADDDLLAFADASAGFGHKDRNIAVIFLRGLGGQRGDICTIAFHRE